MAEKERIIELVKNGNISLEEALDLLETNKKTVKSVKQPDISDSTYNTYREDYEDIEDFSIFIGLDKLDKENLRFQIATLEIMNLRNIFGEQGQKVVNFSKKLLNKDNEFDSKMMTLQDKINKRAIELNSWSLSELQNLLRSVLAAKVKSVGEPLNSLHSDFQLSEVVINVAAKHFNNKINPDLSPEEKADLIQILYYQQLQQQTVSMMDKQSRLDREKTEEAIQKEIDKMTPQQSQELRKALNVENLTGETVRNTLKTGGGTVAMLALNGAGFGAYIDLSTIMHAVFTTTLGVTLPFAAYTSAASFLSFLTGPVGWMILGGAQVWMMNKNKNKLIYQLLAQIVWLSVQANGQFYSETSTSDLPDFMSDMERDKKHLLQKEAQDLKLEMNSLRTQSIQLEQKLLSLKREFNDSKKMIDYYTQEKIKLEKELVIEKEKSNDPLVITQLQNQIFELNIKNIESKQKSEEVIKKFELTNKEKENLEKQIKDLNTKLIDSNEDVYLYEEMIEEIYDEKNELEKTIDQLNLQIESYKESYRLFEKENIESIKDTERRNESKVKKLKRGWDKKFKVISFDSKVYKDVVKNFDSNEIDSIESKLIDMIKVDDPRSLTGNRGKMQVSGDEHVAFNANGDGRIFYEINPKNSKQSIHVKKIVKHNHARYGK